MPRDSATPWRDTGHHYVGPDTKGHYISSTRFALIFQEIAAVKDLLRDQRGHTRGGDTIRSTSSAPSGGASPACPPLSAVPLESYTDLFPHIPAWTPQDNTLITSQAPSIDESLAGLPSKEQSELLIWIYVGGYHAKRSLFHGPTFIVQVREFRDGTYV